MCENYRNYPLCSNAKVVYNPSLRGVNSTRYVYSVYIHS
jgi:hypothetical protein